MAWNDFRLNLKVWALLAGAVFSTESFGEVEKGLQGNEAIRARLLAEKGLIYHGDKANPRVTPIRGKKNNHSDSTIENYVNPTCPSEACVELVKKFEKFRSEPYWDVKHMSIGYGHGILSGENFVSIDEKRASELLLADLNLRSKAVSKYVKVPLTQGQHDALVSFVYNFDETRFSESTLLKKLNNGNYAGAAEELGRWVHTYQDGKKVALGGLVRRREAEYNLFMAESLKDSVTTLILRRDTFTKNSITGKLYEDVNGNGVIDNKDNYLAETLELPYLDNQTNKSSIPLGTYELGGWNGYKFKNCFEVKNVPSRSSILIHAGNYPKDTSGCILVGKERGGDYVSNSRVTLERMNRQYKNNSGGLNRKINLKIIGKN